MQAGLAGTHEWVLEFEPASPRVIEPLMGWTSSSDTRRQLRLTFATKGPFTDFFQSIAGNAFVDWMFMAGLLVVGVALVLGIGVWMAGVSGAAMLMLMYVAANMLPTDNPFLDSHIVYAVIMIVLPLAYSGRTLGLGRWWAATPMVRRFRFLE